MKTRLLWTLAFPLFLILPHSALANNDPYPSLDDYDLTQASERAAFCENIALPDAHPSYVDYISERIPDFRSLFGNQTIKILPEWLLLQWAQEAAIAGTPAIEFFTSDRWKLPCPTYVDSATLERVDSLYRLGLVVPLSGDVRGEDFGFHMNAFVTHEQTHYVFYNVRGRFRFVHPDFSKNGEINVFEIEGPLVQLHFERQGEITFPGTAVRVMNSWPTPDVTFRTITQNVGQDSITIVFGHALGSATRVRSLDPICVRPEANVEGPRCS